MCNLTKRNVSIVLVSCLIISFIFVGCAPKREYHEAIHIPLETHQAEIIIKEWSYLLGSGAEVYYKDGNKEILLGNLLGGDDGFCPFKEGLYSVAVDDNELTIQWCKFPNSERENWEEKTFALPSR